MPITAYRSRPPGWFWLVAVLLVVWQVIGVWSWWAHWQQGPRAMGATPTDYDLRYHAALPGWYVWLYALATFSALAGGVLLLMRQALAVPVLVVSLLATMAMFGYTFLATDLIAAKGVWTVYFPAFIVAVGVLSVLFARSARRRGWIA